MWILRLATGVSLAALGLTLAACGGGGVNSTPTPTPSPAPAPAPTYSTFSEVMGAAGDKSFQTAGVAYQNTSVFSAVPLGTQFKLEYVAASNTYRVIRGSEAAVSFDASAGVGSGAGIVRYDAPGGATLFLLTPHVGGVPLTYTRHATFGQLSGPSSSGNLAVYGVLTKDGDMPRSGSATYSVAVSGMATQPDQSSYLLTANTTGTFSANFGGGTVAAGIDLKATKIGTPGEVSLGTLGGTGAISSSGPSFTGSLAGTGASAPAGSGQFSGAFFGPQAAEFGYAWYFDGATLHAQGYASGKKN